jgi:SAM-dependent methyltransferase
VTDQAGSRPGFADHFSRDPVAYAKFRPRYPETLFTWLATLPDSRRRAWDCATGSGQAAVPLSRHFDLVLASDASLGQLRSAERAPRVRYFAGLGESSPLPTRSIDLVTVAQAMHWLDPARFTAEAGRVLTPGGVLAVWGYGMLRMEGPVGETMARFYTETVGPYWPPERAIVEEGFRSVSLPIHEATPPPLAMEAELTLDALSGYVRTWSAVGRYLTAQSRDPVAELVEDLRPIWGPPEQTRLVRWPLTIRAGRWAGFRSEGLATAR